MEEMEGFLHAEEAALGDLETLEAQLKESNVSVIFSIYIYIFN